MNNLNNIKNTDYPALFEKLEEHDLEAYEVAVLKDEHRRGSNFFKQIVIELKTEDGFAPQFAGFWKTNTWIYDTEYGTDESITELTRVNKVEIEKLVTITTWEEVTN